MVLVPVSQHDARHPVGVLAKEGEVRQHEVDPRHIRLGEHQADVDDDQLAVDLDTGAVATDLPEATEEDDSDGGGVSTPAR